jgi:hypothetical protein
VRRARERLLLLFAALALVAAPVAAQAHRYAAAALGADLCTTADGKVPAPGATHGEHCQCCTGSPPGPPSVAAGGSIAAPDAPPAAAPVVAVRGMRIAAARPRGPPASPLAKQ